MSKTSRLPARHGNDHSPGGYDATPVLRTIVVVINGNGEVLTTGVKVDQPLDQWATIKSWKIVADQVGDIVIDIWKDTYANFPPTDADSITGGSEPFLAAAVKNSDDDLSAWDVDLQTGDILRFNVDSVTDVSRVTLTLEILTEGLPA